MSSSSSVFLDIARGVFSLRHKSPAWQGQRSVQDRLCSKQMHPFMHTDLPLQVQTRSCKKSEDIWPLKLTGTNPFLSSHPNSTAYFIGGFATWAVIQIFICSEDRKTC